MLKEVKNPEKEFMEIISLYSNQGSKAFHRTKKAYAIDISNELSQIQK